MPPRTGGRSIHQRRGGGAPRAGGAAPVGAEGSEVSGGGVEADSLSISLLPTTGGPLLPLVALGAIAPRAIALGATSLLARHRFSRRQYPSVSKEPANALVSYAPKVGLVILGVFSSECQGTILRGKLCALPSVSLLYLYATHEALTVELDQIENALKKALFVCTANICRSPMAEAIFNALAGDMDLSFRAESAGTAALAGRATAPNAVAALVEAGIYPESHRARQVNGALLKKSDLVLAMTPQHVAELGSLYGEFAHKVYTLPEYATGASTDEGVPDPYGHTMAAYRNSVRQLYEYIERLANRLSQLIQPQ